MSNQLGYYNMINMNCKGLTLIIVVTTTTTTTITTTESYSLTFLVSPNLISYNCPVSFFLLGFLSCLVFHFEY